MAKAQPSIGARLAEPAPRALAVGFPQGIGQGQQLAA